MSTTYLSTFATGFNNVTGPALLKLIKDVKIQLELDGLFVYQTSSNINQIRQLRFFNNSFILLHQMKVNSPDQVIQVVEAGISQNITQVLEANLPHRHSTYRIKTFIKNQPVSCDAVLLQKLQWRIDQYPYLHLNKSQAQFEFWCFTRREGFGFYAVKITRSPNYEKTLQKGELRPELAHLLCLMSEPRANDVFLDPFAGHGSIPFERARLMPAAQIVAGDIDTTLVTELTHKTSRLKQRLIVQQLDARHLNLANHTVSKIVTDPPWGIFQEVDIQELYPEMLKEFHRVIKPTGKVVILTAQAEAFGHINDQSKLFKIKASYSTLVSGKKATAFKLQPV